jgi:hypothetical protein
MMSFVHLLLLSLLSLLLTACGSTEIKEDTTQASNLSSDIPAPPPPTQEAYNACNGKSDLETCTLSEGGETQEGECFTIEGESSASCQVENNNQPPAPNDNTPPGQRGAPPPEATNACLNLSEGDNCSFNDAFSNTISGQCHTVPSGEFACLPPR